MKRILPLLLVFCHLIGCAQADSTNSDKILIVYLTRTQNTKAVAEIIQKEVGGDLIALELVKPYPEDYQQHVNQVVRESASAYLPPLKTKLDLTPYDIVFVGFPTWGMQLPPPIKSFLVEYDLSQKTIVPFNTHAGYGVGSGFRQIAKLCPKSEVKLGLSLEGGHEKRGIYLAIKNKRAKEVERQVNDWLRRIKILTYN